MNTSYNLMGRADPSDRLAAAARAAGMPANEGHDARVARSYRTKMQAHERLFVTPPKAIPPSWDATPTAVTMAELRHWSCRFPVGEQGGENQLFCGEPREGRGAYCKACNGRVATKSATQNPRVFH